MNRHRRLSIGLAVGGFCLAAAGWAFAQTGGAETSQPGVVLTKLVGPVYPPLARQASIQGDVNLSVHVRADGSVSSVDLISGHPMLAPAAVESAKGSQFECRGCVNDANLYSLTYAFELRENADCCDRLPNETAVEQVQNRITVVTPRFRIVDLNAELVKIRSIKCLYLWKCGYH